MRDLDLCKKARFYLFIGIIFNITLLCFFKYTDFLLENFNLFTQLFRLDFNIPLPHILLPLALSFVTFQQIAFLVDCYRSVTKECIENKEKNYTMLSRHPMREGIKEGYKAEASKEDYKKGKEEIRENISKENKQGIREESKENSIQLNFIDYCLFITFFPQLIAGPIVHHREMMPQFNRLFKNNKQKKIHWDYIAKGLFIFTMGLFKKVFIADTFAKWANAGFNACKEGEHLNIIESWTTSLSYTFQLYFDFSGYCDMAIGLGLLFGIMLPINFNSPYKALNIADFWRRWHMTLGRFLKDYLYIPLGGNRVKKILILRNLFIVAFLSGIWHGAGFGFIIWGILHGLAMCVHKIYTWQVHTIRHKKFFNSPLYRILCWFITFQFINISWIFFRAENVQSALRLLEGMFGITWVEFGEKWYKAGVMLGNLAGTERTFIYLLFAFIVCLGFKNSIARMEKITNFRMVIMGAVFTCTVLEILATSYTPPFLYFNF